jgi:16S rRNA (adenine1518-N6/adenine1519-N6)-dimethyltransferase
MEQAREGRDQFAAFVRAAFAHRRKTLVNSLKDQGYDHNQVEAALAALHFSPSIRAETLSLDEFIALTHRIHGLSLPPHRQQ